MDGWMDIQAGTVEGAGTNELPELPATSELHALSKNPATGACNREAKIAATAENQPLQAQAGLGSTRCLRPLGVFWALFCPFLKTPFLTRVPSISLLRFDFTFLRTSALLTVLNLDVIIFSSNAGIKN